MKIEVIPFASAIQPTFIVNKTIVVIDVLRATSVMITALANGAKEIFPTLTIEQARTFSSHLSPGTFLLCGERDAKKIKGFHLGNSPLEYTTDIVKNKSIILTTTNGTKALNSCKEANKVFIGAFINLKATVTQVCDIDELIVICSGTQGKFSLDDSICAAMLIDELSKIKKVKVDDLGLSILKTWRSMNYDLNEILRDCYHLNYLVEKGYYNDVLYCLNPNSKPVVPVYKNNLVTLMNSKLTLTD